MSDPPDPTDEGPAEGSSPGPPGDAPREAGWYADPDGSGWRRYWDGSAWAPVTQEQLAERGDGSSRGRRMAQIGVIAAVVIAAIVVIVATTGSSGTKHAASTVASTTAGTHATSTTRATTTTRSTSTTRHTSTTRRTSTTRSTSTTKHTSTTRSTSTTKSTTTTTGASTPVTAAAITAVVNAYVAAYNSHNIAALRALMSPQLVRHGGNGPPQNLAQALAIYQAQFAAEPNPQLRLAGLHVLPGVGAGSAGARSGVNSHGQRTRGTIAFHMTQTGPRLLIDQLVVRNH